VQYADPTANKKRMCNLYRQNLSAADMKLIAESGSLSLDETSRGQNVEPGYVGADSDGPVLSVEGGQLTLRYRRWGFPPVRSGARPITNIRNLDSSWWKGANATFLKESAFRCLIQFSSFAEWSADEGKNAWFEVEADVACFAGVWRPWRGERLMKVEGKKRRERREVEIELFAFLTTEPCETVAKVHPKAMPVILTNAQERQAWLRGGSESFELQRPLDDRLIRRMSDYSLQRD